VADTAAHDPIRSSNAKSEPRALWGDGLKRQVVGKRVRVAATLAAPGASRPPENSVGRCARRPLLALSGGDVGGVVPSARRGARSQDLALDRARRHLQACSDLAAAVAADLEAEHAALARRKPGEHTQRIGRHDRAQTCRAGARVGALRWQRGGAAVGSDEADRLAAGDDPQPPDGVRALGLAGDELEPGEPLASSVTCGRAQTSRATKRSRVR
jgi:hypothetical protein